MSHNANSTNNNENGFSPPVPESIRPVYRQTYVSPEANETPNNYQESIVPPQAPPNTFYQSDVNSPQQTKTRTETSEYPEIPQVDAYNSNYVQNTPPQPSNVRQKERSYIKPITEQEYERERRKEKQTPRSNITPQPEKQQKTASGLGDFSQNNFKWVAWVILFLLIFLIVF